MLPSAYTRPVETGRPHLPIIQELWGKGKKKEGPPLTPSLSPMGRGGTRAEKNAAVNSLPLCQSGRGGTRAEKNAAVIPLTPAPCFHRERGQASPLLTNGDKKYVKVGNEPPRGNLWGITHARLKPCPTEHVICRAGLKVCFYGTSHIPFGKWGEGLHFFPNERDMVEGQDFLNEIASPAPL